MSKVQIACNKCGKLIWRYPSQIKARNFCSRMCLGQFNSKTENPDGYRYRSFEKNSRRFAACNVEWNKTRMTPEIRAKIRAARLGSGKNLSYAKVYGRHEHRIVAEQVFGRPLLPGEIVHHIDGNKRNNTPENLMLFQSQREHASWHAKWEALISRWNAQEEVMST